MGGYLSAPSLSRSQVEEMLQKLERTRIERELAVSEAIERRRRAYELSRDREAFNWLASGGGLTSLIATISSYHHKNLIHLLPIMPIATYIGYKAHFCYGNKQQQIAACTADLVKYDADLLSIAPIGVDDVKRRMKELELIRTEMD
ncbi:hypothetical protein PFISCL1PPCAC_4970 [Pristionchus fissidentatus]|uniref:Uncharacterized protein n=1 Tax=Pristionchus fissidentatus TaxID=1538716 RepID=A0AAV5V5P6_9BILA|nr:hypothetical protein PFISCL1PPCAC_4970 [Pristionchus fissidentatus]